MRPDYDIVGAFDGGDVPAVADAARQLLSYGVKLGSMVRPAQHGKPAAIAVFMLDEAATRALWPAIVAHHKTLPPQDTRHLIKMDAAVTIADIFNEFERVGVSHGWCPFGRSRARVAFFYGCVTEEFCAELTRRGCPTRLL